MIKQRKFLFVKLGLIAATIPFIIHAYEFGPEERRTNAPGDRGTCLASGCHTGALNPAGGSVKITLAGGNSYTPGVKQRIQVQITDAARQKFGFEFTARLASNLANGQAGDFSTVDSLTQTLCDDGSDKRNGSLCPSKTPVQFIEHTTAGYTASTAGGYTYQFDWTPPATDVGNVTFYVASVAGPGGTPNQNNANVYTSNVTLTPAATQPNAPAVTPGGVVPVYSSATTIQPGSWFSVYGTKLAAATAVWNGDFPTNLGGTSVSVNGKDAYLWFVSDGQINAQAPDDTATGSVPFVVKTANGTSTGTVTLATAGPSFLLLGDAKHATGIIVTPDGSGTQAGGTYDLLGPTSAGAGFRPAKKGEPVAIYAVGLGPTNPAVPAGQIFASAAPVITNPTILLGGGAVKVDFAGIVGAGLYQINFTVPQNAGSGEQTLQAIVNGVTTQANITIPLQ